MDVQRYLTDEPVQACPPAPWYRFGKFVRKNKAALSAVGLIAIAIVVGVGMLAVSNVLITHERDQKKEALLKAKASEKEANDQRNIAVTNEKTASKRAEELAWEDYINRVNRAYREVQDNNIELAEDLLLGCSSERRAWEWHYVHRLCHLDRLTLEAPAASVNSVAFSPDGSWLASASGRPITAPTYAAEAQVQLHDLATGRVKQTLKGLKGMVYSVAVSPDGARIAVGSGYEAQLTVWDTSSGQLLWSRLEPRHHSIMSAVFHPGGKSLAVGYGEYSGSAAGQVKVWDVASGRETAAFPGPAGGVSKVAFHPDGKRLAVAGSERVEIWDIATRVKVREVRGHSRWVYTVAFSPDGKWLATGGWDRTIWLWDANAGAEPTTRFGEHDGYVLDLAFSPDGRSLVSTSEDRSVRMWEVPTGRLMATFHGNSDGVNCVAFRPDGQELATGSMDGTARIWNVRTGRPIVFDKHGGNVDWLAFRRDGRRVLSSAAESESPGAARRIIGWDPVTGDVDPALTGFEFDSGGGEFEPEVGPESLASSSSPDRKLVAQVVLSDLWGKRADFRRSKRYAENVVEIRDAESGQVIHTLIGHTAEVWRMAFSPDGRRLATVCFDRTIKLWDVATGRELFTLLGHTSGVYSLAYSPDGLRIACWGFDGTVRIWDATPLPDEALQVHRSRLQQKLTSLGDLKAASHDSRLADLFESTGQWDRFVAVYSRILESHPNNPDYWRRRGWGYVNIGEGDKATADYRHAGEIDPKMAGFSEWLLKAQACYAVKRYVASAGYWAKALAADPILGNDPRTHHLYNAACAAALAGCGQGKDADKLDGKERAHLRRQALDWVRADLDKWGRRLDQEPDKVRPVLIRLMRRWLADPEFASVRGPAALARLPEVERQPWQTLWDDVADLFARVQTKTPTEKKSSAK
jgi:WD40 repeat protein